MEYRSGRGEAGLSPQRLAWSCQAPFPRRLHNLPVELPACGRREGTNDKLKGDKYERQRNHEGDHPHGNIAKAGVVLRRDDLQIRNGGVGKKRADNGRYRSGEYRENAPPGRGEVASQHVELKMLLLLRSKNRAQESYPEHEAPGERISPQHSRIEHEPKYNLNYGQHEHDEKESNRRCGDQIDESRFYFLEKVHSSTSIVKWEKDPYWQTEISVSLR